MTYATSPKGAEILIEALERLTTEPLLSDPGRTEQDYRTSGTEGRTSESVVAAAATSAPVLDDAWPVLDDAAYHALAGDIV